MPRRIVTRQAEFLLLSFFLFLSLSVFFLYPGLSVLFSRRLFAGIRVLQALRSDEKRF